MYTYIEKLENVIMKPSVEQLLTKLCFLFNLYVDANGERATNIRAILAALKKKGSCNIAISYNNDVLSRPALDELIASSGIPTNYSEHGDYFVMLLQETAQCTGLNGASLSQLLSSSEGSLA